MNRRIFAGIVALGWGAGGFALGLAAMSLRWRTTTCRLSPDETLRVRLLDFGPQSKLDRNFLIQLERLKTDEVETIYRSADEPGANHEGAERFLWSKDGTKVLLVSRHFDVRADLMLATGDEAYFLYDTKLRRAWSNSPLTPELDPITADQLNAIEWTEPVVLKPRVKVDPDSPENRE